MGKGTGKGGQYDELCSLFQGVGICACVILFAGPILIIIGGIFLNLGVQNFRQQHIESINSDVNNFNTAVNQGFMTQKLTATFDGSTNCPALKSVDLKPQNQNNDYYPNNDRSALNQYNQFLYQADLPTLAANQSDCTLKTTIKDSKNSVVSQFTFNINQAVIQIPSSSLGCTQNSSACFSQACSGYGGILSSDSQSCAVVNVNAICVRVKKDGQGNYVETDSSPINEEDKVGSGCFSLQTATRQLARVTVLPPCFSVNSTQIQQPITSSGVPKIQVRHANDPYIAYQFVSNGRCTFGESRYRQFSIGVSCTVVGGLITCAWIVAVYFVLSKLIGKRVKKYNKKNEPLPLTGLPFMDPKMKKGNYPPSSTANSQLNNYSPSSNQRIKHGQYPNMFKSSSQYSNDDKNSNYSNSNPYHNSRIGYHSSGHNGSQPKYNTTSESQNSQNGNYYNSNYGSNNGSNNGSRQGVQGSGNDKYPFSTSYQNQNNAQKFLHQFKSDRSMDRNQNEIYSGNTTLGYDKESQNSGQQPKI